MQIAIEQVWSLIFKGVEKMSIIELNLLTDEHWWSGTTALGYTMPYGHGSSCTVDQIHNTSNNQVSPVLMSDHGRFLYAPEGLTYSFDNGKLSVSGDDINYKTLEGGIKSCFEYLKTDIFPDDGEFPDEDLIIHPQYNTWIELTHYQCEEKIIKYAENLVKNDMPRGVIMIDATWQEDYGVWDFHPGRFKNPKGMIDYLHKLGFKVMLWTAPFVSPDSLTYMQLSKNGLLVKSANGEDAVRRWWDGYSAVLDLTNKESQVWFKQQLDRLQKDYGVDGFKFDAGDPEFYRHDDITAKPITPNGQCEIYGMFGANYPLNEYRACFGLAGKPLVQRLADKEHSWGVSGMASLIPNSLAQSLGGYRFICPDMIGGGEYRSFIEGAELDEELFVRYAQCSALMPMMQFSADPFRVLSKINAELCREAAWLHEENGKYILSLIKKCVKDKSPVIAPVGFYDSEADISKKDMFMLSDELLVAPVIEKGVKKKELYLPHGDWLAWNGDKYKGGKRISVKVTMQDLPFFKKIK